MFRYFIHLAYDGTNYKGWQIQPNGNTIQSEITKALSTILKQEISIIGAGRTDTGVHARNYYAHFEMDNLIEELEQLTYKMNRFLPRDITIYKIFKVPNQLHARFSAISRTYKYYISQNRDPFVRDYSWYRFGDLDIDVMNQAATQLLLVSDFTSFSKLHSQTKTNLCKVSYVKWEKTSYGVQFTITADRFLRNMVRAIVGTLIDVGLHKITLAEFTSIVESKNRSSAGESVPANALFLDEIEYPEI